METTIIHEYEQYPHDREFSGNSIINLKVKELEKERDPVRIIAVIDISGSMKRGKLDLVKETLRFLLTQLEEKDQFGIVTYNVETTIFKCQKLNDLVKQQCLLFINSIQASGKTDIGKGLQIGLVQMMKARTEYSYLPDSIESILLFTDGKSNVGIPESIIPNILAKQKQPHKTMDQWNEHLQKSKFKKLAKSSSLRSSKIREIRSPPSNMNYFNEETKKYIEDMFEKHGVTCNTFGMGIEHNANLLKKLASRGNGIYYYIGSLDDIGIQFVSCVSNLMNVALKRCKCIIQPLVPDIIEIDDIRYGKAKATTIVGHKGKQIEMNNLVGSSSLDILVTYKAKKVDAINTKSPLFSVQIGGISVEEKKMVNFPKMSYIHRETTTKKQIPNVQVSEQLNRFMVADAIQQAIRESTKGNYDKAGNIINQVKQSVKHSSAAKESEYLLDGIHSNDFGSNFKNNRNKVISQNMALYQQQCVSTAAKPKFRSKRQSLMIKNLQKFKSKPTL